MNKVYVQCEACQRLSEYHGQYRCEFCHNRFSHWSIANQLRESRDKEFLEQLGGDNEKPSRD